MHLNHTIRFFITNVIFLQTNLLQAQPPTCKDTAEHYRLQTAMWKSCSQDNPKVVYDACMAFQAHAKANNDMLAANSAWVCGVMYNLGRMNIRDAYHITQAMKQEMLHDKNNKQLHFSIANMMGHIYSTCGNIPGAVEEFKKSAAMIKDTPYETDGLTFIYLALAHANLNNDLKESLHWIDENLKELESHRGSWNYYRALADSYAIMAIIRFKQKDYDGFRKAIAMMEEAESNNNIPSGDIFLPYARIYKTLLDGDTEKALKDADALNDKKEQFFLKCDIYRYIGDNDKAFMIQRELMHARDSITGIMIAENIQIQEEEIKLIKDQQEATRRYNIILTIAFTLAVLVVAGLLAAFYARRKYTRTLLKKNLQLEEANEKVVAADKIKTEIIRNVTHEIHTPLNIINGFTQVITNKDMSLDETERSSIAKTIEENTKQITSLINEMLTIATDNIRDLKNDMTDIDIIGICRQVLANMPKTDQKHISIEFENLTHNDKPMIFTNEDCLKRMLSYLLGNAVKFTQEGYIKLSVEKVSDEYRFIVEDTGCGIPDDKRSIIFERFAKIDSFKEGLGLGLPYCREISHKLGGNIVLDDNYRDGARFILTLPTNIKS